MLFRGSNSAVAQMLRRWLRPRWWQLARQRRLVRRASPTAIVAPNAVVTDTKLGKYVLIDGDVWIYQSELGDYSYVADGARVAKTRMGRFCSVAPRAYVGLPAHPSRGFVSSHPIFYQRMPARGQDLADRDYFVGFEATEIGHDVWIARVP